MLHITFTPSGAGILRQALQQQLGQAARNDRVIAFDDPLYLGPINPADPARRVAWMVEHLGVLLDDWDWLPEYTWRFWAESLAAENPIVWASRHSANEYCGLLEWARRRGQAPYRLVDVTDATFVNRAGETTPLRGISQVHPELLDMRALIESARVPQADESEAMRSRWEKLRAENADLRVIKAGEICSAANDYFDPLLLSGARSQWLKTARVIGEAMANTDAMTIGTQDIYLGGRVIELVKLGALEAQGDLRRWFHSEVRLPRGREMVNQT